MSTKSKLEKYSIGIVVINKPLDTPWIEAAPIEDLLMLDGELTDDAQENKTKGVEADGETTYEETAKTTVSVKAKWLPYSSNRLTAPDVRRGEKVQLYRYGDSDKYYWEPLDYEPRLRKLETIIFGISGTRDEDAEGKFDNMYSIQLSTHQKLIHVHTSKADGEPYTYDFQINAKDGNWTFTDDIGNFITVDSKNNRIELKNASGSWIDMDKTNIVVTAPDNITLKAGKTINFSAGQSINSTAGTDINDKASGKINTQATETNNTVPMTKFTGSINVGQNANIAQSLSTKSFTSGAGGGTFTVNSSGTFTQPVTVQKLTSQQNIVAPNVS